MDWGRGAQSLIMGHRLTLVGEAGENWDKGELGHR